MKEFNRMKNRGLLNWYWEKMLAATANMVQIRPGDIVLDFGAGEQELRKHIMECASNSNKYISCDTDKRTNPDIQSLEEIKRADVVFASNVFEHLEKEELEKQLRLICELEPSLLIVAMPWETSWLNKLLNFLCGISFEHGWEHKLGWKQILKALSKHFYVVKVKNFWFMQWMLVLKTKEKGG